jgi:P4 family phage/plasmid primase-like protien
LWGGSKLELKEQVDIKLANNPGVILDIYQQFLGPGKKEKENEYKFSSPWASDSTPSMGVDPHRMGIYKCFSSGEGGNIYTLLNHFSGQLNKKPLLWLADYLNIDVKKHNNKPELVAPAHIMKKAHEYLMNHPGFIDLIKAKGFGQEEIENFNGYGIGYLDDDVYRKRFFIPILNDNGEIADIRLYDPTHSKAGMKTLHFYMFLEDINTVPKKVQEAMKKEDLDKLEIGHKIKLTGFGKARFANLGAFNHDVIYLMEGERDMFNALRLGFNATCLTSGASTWDIAFNYRFVNKKVIIVMDNDDAGLKGAYKKAENIAELAKEVKVVKLPLKEKGSDFSDYVAKHSKEDFIALVNNTSKFEVSYVKQQQAKEIEFTDKTPPRLYAKHIYNTTEILYVNTMKSFYTYRESGFWKNTDDFEIKQMIFRLYEQIGLKEITATSWNMAFNSLQAICGVADRPGNHWRYINCRNGLYDLEQKQMIPHTKSIFTTHQLPMEYDSDATCPRFMQYLEEVFPQETDAFKALVAEVLGYCMTTDTSFQVAFAFIGRGANGKSVLLSILEELVGHENVSAVAFSELSSTFSRVTLKDKLVNVGAEIDFSSKSNTSFFKQIVAGETIAAQEKNKPEFHFKPTVKLVYATNGFPVTNDKSHGYYRRWKFIPFNVTFPKEKQDRNLISKLKKELPGILNFAIDGLNRLQRNGKFTDPKQIDEMLDQYKELSNPLAQFVKENVVFSPSKRYKRSEFVKEYSAWSRENNYKPMAASRVAKELEETYNIKVKKTMGDYYLSGLYIHKPDLFPAVVLEEEAEEETDLQEVSKDKRLEQLHW